MQESIYETITNQIVAAMEEGAGTYTMPWHRSRYDVASPSNAEGGHAYRGINTLSLWMTAEARGYGSGQWATYRQWQALGAQVRKGEKAASIVFWKSLQGEHGGTEAAHEPEERRAFVACGYAVFNADQVDGYTPETPPMLPESERIEAAERFFAAIPARIEHGGNSAFYAPRTDHVQLPPFGRFTSGKAYCATLAHELTHWSGTKPRLDRDLSGRFGDDAYAMEELIAELGAAFTIGRLGLPSLPREDHAAYIANWLKVLKRDSRAIFTAASQAQRAADYLAGFSELPV